MAILFLWNTKGSALRPKKEVEIIMAIPRLAIEHFSAYMQHHFSNNMLLISQTKELLTFSRKMLSTGTKTYPMKSHNWARQYHRKKDILFLRVGLLSSCAYSSLIYRTQSLWPDYISRILRLKWLLAKKSFLLAFKGIISWKQHSRPVQGLWD